MWSALDRVVRFILSRWSNKCKCFAVRFVFVQASGFICNEKGEFLPSLKSRRSFWLNLSTSFRFNQVRGRIRNHVNPNWPKCIYDYWETLNWFENWLYKPEVSKWHNLSCMHKVKNKFFGQELVTSTSKSDLTHSIIQFILSFNKFSAVVVPYIIGVQASKSNFFHFLQRGKSWVKSGWIRVRMMRKASMFFPVLLLLVSGFFFFLFQPYKLIIVSIHACS